MLTRKTWLARGKRLAHVDPRDLFAIGDWLIDGARFGHVPNDYLASGGDVVDLFDDKTPKQINRWGRVARVFPAEYRTAGVAWSWYDYAAPLLVDGAAAVCDVARVIADAHANGVTFETYRAQIRFIRWEEKLTRRDWQESLMLALIHDLRDDVGSYGVAEQQVMFERLAELAEEVGLGKRAGLRAAGDMPTHPNTHATINPLTVDLRQEYEQRLGERPPLEPGTAQFS